MDDCATPLHGRRPQNIQCGEGLIWDVRLNTTGGVSYSVGGAAAPPTLAFATPTSWLALPHQFSIAFEVFWIRNDHVHPNICRDIRF